MDAARHAIDLLESALLRSGDRWRWATVMVKKPVGDVYDFSHFSERDRGVPTLCHEVEGAPLTLIVATDAWKATGRDLAAFPNDVDRLLELFPEYPNAQVTLPNAPKRAQPSPAWDTGTVAAVMAEARHLEQMSGWCSQIAAWLERCAELIAEGVAKVEAEGLALRKSVKESSYQDWHINGLDTQKRSISVMGRQMQVSARRPAGTTEDLRTLHIDTILSQIWKANYLPVVRVEAVNYGTCLVKITIGRGSGSSRDYWVDLKEMTLVNTGKKTQAPKRRAT